MIFHAFQVTVAEKHPCKTHQLEGFHDQVRTAEVTNINLYYLVPADRYIKFVTAPVNPKFPGKKKTNNIFHVCIPNPKDE